MNALFDAAPAAAAVCAAELPAVTSAELDELTGYLRDDAGRECDLLAFMRRALAGQVTP